MQECAATTAAFIQFYVLVPNFLVISYSKFYCQGDKSSNLLYVNSLSVWNKTAEEKYMNNNEDA